MGNKESKMSSSSKKNKDKKGECSNFGKKESVYDAEVLDFLENQKESSKVPTSYSFYISLLFLESFDSVIHLFLSDCIKKKVWNIIYEKTGKTSPITEKRDSLKRFEYWIPYRFDLDRRLFLDLNKITQIRKCGNKLVSVSLLEYQKHTKGYEEIEYINVEF